MRRLYEERIKILTKEERRKRRELWEERLRDMTPGEREELKKKLEEVKKRKDLEDLRHRRHKVRDIEKKFLDGLPPETRAKVEALPREKREELRYYSFGRMFELTRQCFSESLTEAERKKLDRQHGPGRWGMMREIMTKRALATLPEKERARIAALPKADRKLAERKVMHQLREAQHAEVRKRLAREIREVLELPLEEWNRKMAPHRLKHLLYRMHVHDRELMKLIDKLTPELLEKVLEEVEEIARLRDRDERRKAIRKLKTRLSR